MNIHKNARTTPQSRAMLVHRVLIEQWPVAEVAMAFGVSAAHGLQVAGALPQPKVRRACRIGRRRRAAVRMR